MQEENENLAVIFQSAALMTYPRMVEKDDPHTSFCLRIDDTENEDLCYFIADYESETKKMARLVA